MLAALMPTWIALRANRQAVTALEYGLIISMVAVVITMALDMTGNHLVRVMDKIASTL